MFWCPWLWQPVLLSHLLLPFIFPSLSLFLYEFLFIFLSISALQFDSPISSKIKPTFRLNGGLSTFYLGKCQKNFQNYRGPLTHFEMDFYHPLSLYHSLLPFSLPSRFLFHSILFFWHDLIQDTQSCVRCLSSCPSAPSTFLCDGSYHTLWNYLSVFHFKCQDLSS